MSKFKLVNYLAVVLLLILLVSPINLDFILFSLIVIVSILAATIETKFGNNKFIIPFFIWLGTMMVSAVILSSFFEGRTLSVIYSIFCIIAIQIAISGMNRENEVGHTD